MNFKSNKKIVILFMCLSLISTLRTATAATANSACKIVFKVGANGAVIVNAVGFTSSGIAAGSIASKMMSWTAIFYGGGVPADSLVARLQSIGAKGFGWWTRILDPIGGKLCDIAFEEQ